MKKRTIWFNWNMEEVWIDSQRGVTEGSKDCICLVIIWTKFKPFSVLLVSSWKWKIKEDCWKERSEEKIEEGSECFFFTVSK